MIKILFAEKKMKCIYRVIYTVLLLWVSCTSNSMSENFDTNSNVDCVDTNCADYTSQNAAQAAFNSDPECRNDLDADNDGIACEEPGNSVTTCSNTSNCGCSNKRKSQCQNDPCCRWVVGEGCKCA